MRYQGKITDWNDEKGFGFVSPNGGGARVFVHIKSFSNRQRRPVGNELVTYELASDSRGRPQGINIAFTGDRPSSPVSTAPGPGLGSLVFAVIFLVFVTVAVAIHRLPFLVVIVYLLASCITYLAYYSDKRASSKGSWRTPESALHFYSLVGGWPGAMFAQRVFRHKTQKESFQVTFWMTVVLNCAAVGYLLSPSGMSMVKILRSIS